MESRENQVTQEQTFVTMTSREYQVTQEQTCENGILRILGDTGANL